MSGMGTGERVNVRPPGTRALIWGVVSLAAGMLLWPLGIAGATGIGAGGIVAVAVGLGGLVVGLVQRLGGGPGRPVDVPRVVVSAVAIPLAVGAVVTVLIGF